MDETANVWVYILEQENGYFYTGWTTDVRRRFREHTGSARGARALRVSPPKHVAACWKIKGGRPEALKVEAYIKKQKRDDKKKLIRSPDILVQNIQNHLGLCISSDPKRKLDG